MFVLKVKIGHPSNRVSYLEITYNEIIITYTRTNNCVDKIRIDILLIRYLFTQKLQNIDILSNKLSQLHYNIYNYTVGYYVCYWVRQFIIYK